MKVINADCIEAMADMDEASVDAIVTDPPYGLGFMGKKWDDLPPGPEFAEQALRVLKPGGHLAAFGGTRTYHRLTVAIEDAGFEIRDCLMWLYGSGFPKSHNLKDEWNGWGTALKPAHEPIVLARKPLEGTVAANVQKWGTGALNIDGCRIGTEGGTKRDGRATEPNSSGWANMRGHGIAEVQGGRWPANLALNETAAEMLDEQSGERKSGKAIRSKSGGKNFGSDTKKPPLEDIGYEDQGGASRFFYCAKASKSERNAGLDGFEERGRTLGFLRCAICGKQKVNVPGSECRCSDPKWVKVEDHSPRANHHPTVKPIDLMRWLVRLVTPPGGTVLDPFTGSGTTGIAAALEGFDFIGIEREAEYAEIARARIEHWNEQPKQEALL